jgi:phospholipase/carboxylesterase
MSDLLVHDIVPPRRPGRRPAWVLVLHGLGDSKEGWKDVAPMLHLDGVGFIFAQAPDPHPPGWSWFAIDPGFGANVPDVRRSRALIDGLIAHLLTTLGIGADRLVLMGFSQGCLMVLDQGFHGSRTFAGIVGISGFTADCDSLGPAATTQRILWTHGRFDGLIPLAWTRGEMKRLRTLGIEADWREYDKDHGIDPEHEIPDIAAFIGDRLA